MTSTEIELMRARLAAAHIECSQEDLEVILAGSPAARLAVERIARVDLGDTPPMAPRFR